MLADRPLRIEVLVNSPGPHDQVRIREPFGALQQLGVDCRIHERPFRFSSCIRPHSLVIWQRPLPESRQRQWEHLQWLRERGCLLLTEWDDHPDLFPESIRSQLESVAMAPLALCHALHTSSPRLALELRKIQPLCLVLENGVEPIPALHLDKHSSQRLRVLVANQNRNHEHQAISAGLQQWAGQWERLQFVVVGDRALAAQLPRQQLEHHPQLDYHRYRQLLRSCQIALLPLDSSTGNACKTPIKLLECAAESVAAVCGPELYGRWAPAGVSMLVGQLSDVVPAARTLANTFEQRLRQVRQAHRWVKTHWSLEQSCRTRLWLYQQLWQRRLQLDRRLVERLQWDGALPGMQAAEFASRADQA